jgi:para-nitrobenzyl esterase
MLRPALLLIAFCIAVLSATLAAAKAPQVTIAQGLLAGTSDGAVDAYRGIPYTAAPMGKNRWRAPQPMDKWTGARKADRFAANCMQSIAPPGLSQSTPWTSEYQITGPVSEDCLYLNVWTPARRAAKPLPVFFWIHGGGFSSGGGDVPIYDGRNLAARGIVVVTINYRLGLYGFLAHPALSAEQGGSSGNYGLLDQIAALHWVKENIRAFGGDASSITIAGQSAGAASVHDLILSPLAKGLFARAIAESGSGMGIPLPSKSDADTAGLRFAETVGARSLDELRALTSEQIEKIHGAQLAPIVVPTADGRVLPEDPAAALREGRYCDTPILTGYNSDESTSFGGQQPTTEASYRQLVGNRYGTFVDRILELYPAQDYATSAETLARDRIYASMLLWAQEHRRTSHYPVYEYVFTHIEPGPQSAKFKSFHSSEIPYVFDTLDKAPERKFSTTDRAISIELQNYWLNFVRTGDPNGTGLPTWPAADNTLIVMEIGERAHAREAIGTEQFALFQDFVAHGGALGMF